MAEKGFGVKEVNLIGASGTPTITSPNNLNLNAVNVAISTNASIGGNLTVSGTVGIAGTLTYEDVTNIDSVGLITARTGVKVLAGGINVVGVSTFAGSTYFTNQDNYFKHDNSTVRFQRTSSTTQQGAIMVGNSSFDIFTHSGGSGNFRVYTGGAYKLSLNSSGTLTATTFSGSGASLTNLPAANLTGTLPVISGANLTGIAVTEAPVTDYTITGDGSHYYFHGGGVDETAGDPDLYLIRGQKYRFNNTTGSGHPFEFRIADGGSAYSNGVSGDDEGVQFFTVPYDAPAKIFYQCTIHGGMVGNIYIRGAGGQNHNVGISTFSSIVVAADIAINRPRIVLSAPGGTNFRHLFGANLEVNSSGTFTTPTANISGGGWQYISANSINNHGKLTYLSAPDTNTTSSTPLERFRIDGTGNVGIATDNPSTKLDVDGDITIRNGNEQNAIRTNSDGKLQLLYNAAVNNTPSVTIDDTNGYVGINTDNPTARFEISHGVTASQKSAAWLDQYDNTTLRIFHNQTARLGLYTIEQGDWSSGTVLATIDGSTTRKWGIGMASNGKSTYASGLYFGYRADTSNTGQNTFNTMAHSLILPTTGDVRVNVGNLVIATNNKGISFSGSSSSPDTDSTSSTRVITDYDEGTCDWELHRSDGLTTGSNTATTKVTYTKIGNRVMMSGYVYTASTGSSTSSITARLTDASGNDASLPYTPNHEGGLPIMHTRTITEYHRMSVSFAKDSKTVYVHKDDGTNNYIPNQNNVAISSPQTHLVIAFTGSYTTDE